MLEIKVFDRPDNGRPVLVIYDPIIYSSSTPPIFKGPLRQSFILNAADRTPEPLQDSAIHPIQLDSLWASFPGSRQVFVEFDFTIDNVLASMIREDEYGEVVAQSLVLTGDRRWAIATASVQVATGDHCADFVTFLEDIRLVADWLANCGVFVHESWRQIQAAYPGFEAVVDAAVNCGYIVRVGGHEALLPENSEATETTRGSQPLTVSGSRATCPAAPREDGVYLPRTFVYGGNEYQLPKGKLPLFIDLLWQSRHGGSIEFDEMLGVLYEHAVDISDSAVASLRARANSFFETNGIPATVNVAGRYVTLTIQSEK